MLFMRGNAMSGAPIIKGTNQLPKPPISAGITRKNTMMRPWPGDEHVVGLRVREELQPRLLQLHAHADRQRGADEAGAEREDQVERADVLVVRRIEPAPPEGRRAVVIMVVGMGGVGGVCGHGGTLWSSRSSVSGRRRA
jgi:hypothetical protein